MQQDDQKLRCARRFKWLFGTGCALCIIIAPIAANSWRGVLFGIGAALVFGAFYQGD